MEEGGEGASLAEEASKEKLEGGKCKCRAGDLLMQALVHCRREYVVYFSISRIEREYFVVLLRVPV